MTDTNIIAGAPTEEPARQQYFMEQVKKLVEAESAKKAVRSPVLSTPSGAR